MKTVNDIPQKDRDRRARRRRDLAARKKKARLIHPFDGTAKAANHLKQCSCFICGNPRKWTGEKTLAERRAAQADDT